MGPSESDKSRIEALKKELYSKTARAEEVHRFSLSPDTSDNETPEDWQRNEERFTADKIRYKLNIF